MLFAKEEHLELIERRLRDAAGDTIDIIARSSELSQARIRSALTEPDMICVGPGIDPSVLNGLHRNESAGLPHIVRVGGFSDTVSNLQSDPTALEWSDHSPLDDLVMQLEACAHLVAQNRSAANTVLRHPTAEYRPDLIALPHQRGIEVRSIMSIVHVKGEGNYTTIHFDKGSHLVMSRTIGDYDDVLPPGQFIRVHRSHIVNLHHIRKIVRGKVMRLVLSNDHQVDVAEGKREMVLGLVNIVRRR